MSYHRGVGALAIPMPTFTKPVTAKPWVPTAPIAIAPVKPWIPVGPVAPTGMVVPKGTWSDTAEGPVWTPEGAPPPQGTVPRSDGTSSMFQLKATSVAQNPVVSPALLMVGGLAVAGFLVYRHFKKKGTSS